LQTSIQNNFPKKVRYSTHKKVNEQGSYYSSYSYLDADNPYETWQQKKIFSRWVPSASRSFATEIASRALARYRHPPRSIPFQLFKGVSVELGQTKKLEHRSLEDAHGAGSQLEVVVSGVKQHAHGQKCSSEEIVFDDTILPASRIFQIDYNTKNINFRDIHDEVYASVSTALDMVFIISSNVVIGSVSTSLYSIRTGTWPSGTTLKLVVSIGAYVVGAGGDAGGLGGNGFAGSEDPPGSGSFDLTSGGVAGPAADGNSLVTWNNLGTVYGARIN